MSGEQVAFRRAALGGPISLQSSLIDRARVNKGGRGTSTSTGWNLSTSGTNFTITCGSANTKGLYTEIYASTSHAVEMMTMFVAATFQSATDTSILLDVGVGADGAEVDVIPNFAVGWRNVHTLYNLPFYIPAGSRIAVRAQSAVAAKAFTFNLELRQSGDALPPPTTCVTYGVSTVNSHSTTLATPGAINTKGAYTELTSATTADANRLFPTVQGDSDGFGSESQLIDIAVGAAGSEVVIIPNLLSQATTTETHTPYWNMPYVVDIPAGTRISARYQTSAIDLNSKPAIAVHCFR